MRPDNVFCEQGLLGCQIARSPNRELTKSSLQANGPRNSKIGNLEDFCFTAAAAEHVSRRDVAVNNANGMYLVKALCNCIGGACGALWIEGITRKAHRVSHLSLIHISEPTRPY